MARSLTASNDANAALWGEDDDRRLGPASAAVAAGSIKLRQVVDEAEARSYETALRQRSAQQQTEGRTGTAGTARLSAAPVLTRFVEDPSQPGARRYRRPRFAGPAF